jgi:hypothetical protein
MSSRSTSTDAVPVTLGALSAPWATEAQAEIIALYRQIECCDPNEPATIAWARQLISGTRRTNAAVV